MGGLGTAVRTPEVAQWPDFARITTGKNMQKNAFFPKIFKMDVFDPRLSGSGPNGLKMIGDEVETPRGPWQESWTPVVVPGHLYRPGRLKNVFFCQNMVEISNMGLPFF